MIGVDVYYHAGIPPFRPQLIVFGWASMEDDPQGLSTVGISSTGNSADADEPVARDD